MESHNFKWYLGTTIVLFFVSLIGVANAVPITVPSAPGSGYSLVSTTTGAYIATTTDPFHVGSLYATSSSEASRLPLASTTALSATTLCFIGDTCRTTWPSAGAGVWPFTPSTNYGVAVQATTTPEWFQNGLISSSTIYTVTVDASSSYAIGGDTILIHPKTPNPDNDARTNIGLGFAALTSLAPISSTQYNTAVGFEALASLTTSDHNTALGAWSCANFTDTTSGNNTCLGIDALRSATAGQYNVAVGEHSLTDATSPGSDTAVGNGALYHMTTGQANTAVGNVALEGIAAVPLTGNNNTAVGNAALEYISSTGAANTAIGAAAMKSVLATPLTGTNNTAVGDSALTAIITTAAQNTAVGMSALIGNTTGNNNIAMGFNAGKSNITGNASVFLGRDAGFSCTGSSNILIGQNIDCPTAANSGQLNIGSLLFGTGLYNNSGGALSSSPTATGALGIGTSTPFWRLTIASSTGPQIALTDTGVNTWTFRGISGSLYFATSSGATFATSTTAAFSIDTNGYMYNPILGTAAGTFLASDPSGKIIATSTPVGGSASTTLLTDSNTFSGNNSFNIASTSAYKQDGTNLLFASSTNDILAVGQLALANYFHTTAADGVTAVGNGAMQFATSSQFDTALGYQAILGQGTISSTGFNTGIGYQTIKNLTSGNSNVGIGYRALVSNTSGTGNIGIGAAPFGVLTTGNQNIAIGNNAGVALISGSNNTFIGGTGVGHGSTGSANTFIGRDAGFSCTSGNSNIMLGQNIDCPVVAGSGQLNIGSVIFGSGLYNNSGGALSSTPAAGGLIGIATSSPYWSLTVASSTGPQLALVDGSGSSNAWTFRNVANTLYIATSTLTATSSVPAVTINPNGKIITQDVPHGWSGVQSPTHAIVLSTATTTTWGGTTTASYIPDFTTPFSGTLKQGVCHTDQSYLNVDIYIGATHLPLILGVNATPATTTFSSNNTFGEGAILSMSAGTTTTASALKVSCTLYATETP